MEDRQKILKQIKGNHVVASKEFKKWQRDNTLLNELHDLSFLGAEILVEIFRFIPEENKQSKLVDLEGKNLGAQYYARTYPLAKVLKLGANTPEGISESLKPGDIVTLRDDLFKLYPNPDYAHFMEAQKERPAPNMQEHGVPPKYLSKMMEYDRYKYHINKFEHYENEVHYLLPPMTIVSKWDYKKK